jgi:hypothetical protein
MVIAASAAVAVAAWLFQPWQLFVDTTVSDPPPSALAAPVSASTPTPSLDSPSRPAAPQTMDPPQTIDPPRTPAKATVVRQGTLISHEHETSGSVKIIQQPDGSRVLRIEDLQTTSGPDLRVWLTAAPVVAGRAGWFVFDDHPHRELGKLKGNRGNQNYAIPPEADLTELENAVIWCRRFHVSFGAAELSG